MLSICQSCLYSITHAFNPTIVSSHIHVGNLSLMYSLCQSCHHYVKNVKHVLNMSLMSSIYQWCLQFVSHVFSSPITSSICQSCLRSDNYIFNLPNLLFMSSVCYSCPWFVNHAFCQDPWRHTLHDESVQCTMMSVAVSSDLPRALICRSIVKWRSIVWFAASFDLPHSLICRSTMKWRPVVWFAASYDMPHPTICRIISLNHLFWIVPHDSISQIGNRS